MKYEQIEVECYAGSRTDERPRRVRACGREHIIARLVSSSVCESVESRQQVRCYLVLTEEGFLLELVLTSDGQWHLERMRRIEE